MINLAYLSSVRIVLTLVALICDLSFLHMFNLVAQFIMIYILVLIWKLSNIPTTTAATRLKHYLQTTTPDDTLTKAVVLLLSPSPTPPFASSPVKSLSPTSLGSLPTDPPALDSRQPSAT
jgi:hypothetical protein